MRFEERLTVPATPSEAWELLWDTRRLAGCIGSCREVREEAPGERYRALFEDSVGPYKLRFDMQVVVLEARPPEHVRLRATGKDARLGVTQNLTLDVNLTPAGDDQKGQAGQTGQTAQTGIDIVAEVEILGKVATLGQFVIKRKVKAVIDEFATNISRELGAAA